MELLIRSQDKKTLAKIDCIILSKYNKLIGYGNIAFELGSYETEPRALEVLDQIQNILILKDMYKYDRELVLKSWENVDEEQVKIVREQMSVYEMPKE